MPREAFSKEVRFKLSYNEQNKAKYMKSRGGGHEAAGGEVPRCLFEEPKQRGRAPWVLILWRILKPRRGVST